MNHVNYDHAWRCWCKPFQYSSASFKPLRLKDFQSYWEWNAHLWPWFIHAPTEHPAGVLLVRFFRMWPKICIYRTERKKKTCLNLSSHSHGRYMLRICCPVMHLLSSWARSVAVCRISKVVHTVSCKQMTVLVEHHIWSIPVLVFACEVPSYSRHFPETKAHTTATLCIRSYAQRGWKIVRRILEQRLGKIFRNHHHYESCYNVIFEGCYVLVAMFFSVQMRGVKHFEYTQSIWCVRSIVAHVVLFVDWQKESSVASIPHKLYRVVH